MKYPTEHQVLELFGPEWRLVLMESWKGQSFFLKIYYTITRRHLWRVIRNIEESS